MTRAGRFAGSILLLGLLAAAPARAGETVFAANQSTDGLAGISLFQIGSGGELAASTPATVGGGDAPAYLAITPNGSYVYVSDFDGSEISQYTVGSGGTLTADSSPTIGAGTGPFGIAVSPNGEYVYVANYDGGGSTGGISQYTINANGTLSVDSPASIPAGNGPQDIAVSPNGEYLYVVNDAEPTGTDGISQYTIGAGGKLGADTTASVNTGSYPYAIAISPNGQYVYVANSGSTGSAAISQYTVGANGELSPDTTPTVNGGNGPDGIAVSPNGQYVYTANGSGTVSQFTIGAGGALAADTPATVGAGAEPANIAVSPDDRYAYVTNYGSLGSAAISQYTIGSGGTLTPDSTATITGGDQPNGIVVAPDSGPLASFTAQSGAAGAASSFTSTASDPDESIATDSWSFGDGATATGATVAHTYMTPGNYTVTLTVADAAGCSSGFPLFSGEAGPFTGIGSACSPDTSAQSSQTVTVAPAPPGIPALNVVKTSSTEVTVAVTCTGDAEQSCSGTLALTAVEHKTGHKITAVTAKARHKHTTHTVTVGTGSFSLAAGSSQTVTIDLNGTGTSLLRKFHKLRANLALTLTGATSSSASATVTFNSPKHRHKRH